MMSLKIVFVALAAVGAAQAAPAEHIASPVEAKLDSEIWDKIQVTLATIRDNINKMDEQLKQVINTPRSGQEETGRAQGVIWTDAFDKAIMRADMFGVNVSQCNEMYRERLDTLVRDFQRGLESNFDKEEHDIETVQKEVLDDLRNQTIYILKEAEMEAGQCDTETCRWDVLSSYLMLSTYLGTRTANTSPVINGISNRFHANIWGYVDFITYFLNNKAMKVVGDVNKCVQEKINTDTTNKPDTL